MSCSFGNHCRHIVTKVSIFPCTELAKVLLSYKECREKKIYLVPKCKYFGKRPSFAFCLQLNVKKEHAHYFFVPD